MTAPGNCPGLETLALLSEGDGDTLKAHEAHLADCPACIERIAAMLAEGNGASARRADAERVWQAVSRRLDGDAAATRVPVTRFLPSRRMLAAAAAVILAAAGGAVWLSLARPETKKTPPPVLTGARPLGAAETRIVAAAGTPDTFLCPDGSAVRLAPGSAVSLDATRPGERVRLRLERGTLDAEVLKANAGFVVAAEGGEVRVVGTLFRARAFRIHAPGGPAIPFLSVEVSRGAVDLSGPQGTRRIAAGARGLVWKKEGPLLQAAETMSWQAALKKWGAGFSSPGFAASPGCAVLLGGSWTGADTWRDAMADLSAPAEERRIAAFLVGITAHPNDHDRMLADFRSEREPAVRAELLPHLARVLADDALPFLKAVSADDADATVRERAASLVR